MPPLFSHSRKPASWLLNQHQPLQHENTTVASWTTLVVHNRDIKDCGGTQQRKFTLKPAKIPYKTIWQYWLGNTKPKKAFRLILNTFKKLLQNLKKLLNGIFYCLTNWCLQTHITQQWLRLRAWFFRCSMSLQHERCLLPYRCTCNAFFMDLPRLSFVSHSSLFTTKSVDCTWWLPFLPEIVCSGYCDYNKFFLNSCWFVLLINRFW